MKHITATEFENDMSAFSAIAMREPVFITTGHERDCLVLLSAAEYRRLTGMAAVKGVSAERRRLIQERAAYHRATLLDLANR